MPKDWRGNVRYLLKQLFRWRLNCTEIAQASDRRAVFPHHYPKRTPTANLLKEPFLALPKIVLFYALPQVLSPFTRSAKESLLNVAFIHEISCQKSRRRRFAPSGTSLSSWHYFVILSHLLLNRRGSAASIDKGFTSNGRLVFSPPPPHGDTPSLRISFTSQTPQESQRLIPTSPLIVMTKILLFPSRKRSYSRGDAILPHRWAGFPSQPTPRSEGIESLRAIANMAYAFSSRYKRRQWVACSRCAKRRITPA